jgi:hypothetical protein
MAAKEILAKQMEDELTAARKTTLPGMEDPDAASSRRLKEMMSGRARLKLNLFVLYFKSNDQNILCRPPIQTPRGCPLEASMKRPL